MMITGITVLALAFCLPTSCAAMDKPDFERLLPMVLTRDRAAGRRGPAARRLLAAFMSNFAATINAAPAYIVNDIYKRFINPTRLGANVRRDELRRVDRRADRRHRRSGLPTTTASSTSMMWIVGALYGGYVMANVLKWYWWRFNGYGYFWGMMAGIWCDVVPSRARDCSQILSPEVAIVIRIRSIRFRAARAFARRLPARHVSHAAGRRRRCSSTSTARRGPGAFGGRSATRSSAEDPTFQPNTTFGRDMHQCARRHRLANVPHDAANLPRACSYRRLGWSLGVVLVDVSVSQIQLVRQAAKTIRAASQPMRSQRLNRNPSDRNRAAMKLRIAFILLVRLLHLRQSMPLSR